MYIRYNYVLTFLLTLEISLEFGGVLCRIRRSHHVQKSLRRRHIEHRRKDRVPEYAILFLLLGILIGERRGGLNGGWLWRAKRGH